MRPDHVPLTGTGNPIPLWPRSGYPLHRRLSRYRALPAWIRYQLGHKPFHMLADRRASPLQITADRWHVVPGHDRRSGRHERSDVAAKGNDAIGRGKIFRRDPSRPVIGNVDTIGEECGRHRGDGAASGSVPAESARRDKPRCCANRLNSATASTLLAALCGQRKSTRP